MKADFKDDLHYVRAAVEHHQARDLAMVIPALWALIVVVGFTLQDFLPAAVKAFWIAAVPIGILISCALGIMHNRGRMSATLRGQFELLHWLSIPVALGLLFYIFGHRSTPAIVVTQVNLLIVAIVYFLAGLHLNRVWIYGAMGMVLGILIIPLLPTIAFTITGSVVGASLLLGLFAHKHRLNKATLGNV